MTVTVDLALGFIVREVHSQRSGLYHEIVFDDGPPVIASARDLVFWNKAQELAGEVAQLRQALEPFAHLDEEIARAEKIDAGYGIHITGDSALGVLFSLHVAQACDEARAALGVSRPVQEQEGDQG